jgi:hypothetical protein
MSIAMGNIKDRKTNYFHTVLISNADHLDLELQARSDTRSCSSLPDYYIDISFSMAVVAVSAFVFVDETFELAIFDLVSIIKCFGLYHFKKRIEEQ